jgi:iron complex outermembrane receptor protein
MMKFYGGQPAGTARYVLGLLVFFAISLLSGISYAQEKSVSGKVIEAGTGNAVPGATVVEKGTQNGMVTDRDGSFKISVGNNATLVISFVGYASKEVAVGNQSNITIELEEDIQQLSEVVVVGYGTQEAKDVTGVVATVNSDQFNKGAIASPDNLISGKVAGVVVTPSTEPGGGSSIRIRGVTSLLGGQEPLFVVDGIILDNSGYTGGRNGLNFINPNDIESMTVLKDASAAAIYGARGAAGVILVTTKSGKDGKSVLSYDGFYSYSSPKKDFGFLSPANFRTVINNEAPQYLPDLGDENTIWVDEVLQPVTGQSHNISFSGGNSKTTYSASVNHMVNNGVVKYSQNKITRANVKLTSKFLNDNLTLSVQQRSALTQDDFSSNVTLTALTFDPTKPVYDPEKPENGGYWEWEEGLAPTNPVSTLDQIDNIGETRRSFTAVNLDYNFPFLEGLAVHVTGSVDLRDGKNKYFEPTTHISGTNHLGNVSLYSSTAHTYNFEPYLSYKREIENLGTTLEVMAGYSYQDVYQESLGFSGTNLTKNVYGWNDPSVIGLYTSHTSGSLQNQLQAFYGRLNVSVKDKYLLTSNIRYDGSTKFGPENRYGIFPSIALGWRMLDEEFMSFLKGTFSDLKLRVGWGQLGNQQIGDYLYEKYYFLSTSDATYQFGDTFYNMLRPTGVDPAIQWEATTTTNIGFEFGLLDNRLSGTLEFYDKRTTNLLASVAPPAFTNVSDVVVTNIAEMNNKGIELGLNFVVMDKADFDWRLNFNSSWNNNEITKLDNGGADSPGYEWGGISGDVGQTIQIIKVGEPYAAFRTYVRDINGASLGGVKYEDVNDDGQINEQDLQITGNPAPKFILGLTSNMTYKDFNLYFTLRGNFGNQVYNNTASANGYYEQLYQGSILNNIHESALETGYTSRQLKSDYYIENASFLRMDNITLTYNYNKLDFVKVKVYGTVQNLFTLTGYSGPNPEVSSGIDNNLYPLATTYILGLGLTF